MRMGSFGDRRGELSAYLALLAAGSEPGRLLDVRHRRRAQQAMRQRFYALRAPPLERLLALSERGDLYVGVAPRALRAGGRDALAPCRLIWADCDTPQAAAALSALPATSMLVASGSASRRHAYWRVTRPLLPDELAEANRRLAAALGADQGAVTGPAAILRPPGTYNHKHSPPAAARLVAFNPQRVYALPALMAGVPALATPAPARHVVRRQATGDPLRAISPHEYVRLLTGERVPRQGKVRCPLHRDEHASLHAWAQPERGWFCFGCNRGGDIYRLAELMWGVPARGEGFLELRRRLRRLCASVKDAA
jgi:hypothetical protein